MPFLLLAAFSAIIGARIGSWLSGTGHDSYFFYYILIAPVYSPRPSALVIWSHCELKTLPWRNLKHLHLSWICVLSRQDIRLVSSDVIFYTFIFLIYHLLPNVEKLRTMRWFSMYRSSGSVIQYSINKGVLRKRGSIYISLQQV